MGTDRDMTPVGGESWTRSLASTFGPFRNVYSRKLRLCSHAADVAVKELTSKYV